MDAVEDIKNKLSIEDVISQYIELKRAGRNFKGLSPFNSEKTPSFMVSPEKQIWHDFSSGKGGNVFSFVMEMEGTDFKGALDLLARQAGIDLSQYQRGTTGTRSKQKEQLSSALDLAAKFYQAHLKKNLQALQYVFKTRSINKQTALDFRLGYAPESGDSLTKFLLGKGYKLADLKLAGLSTQRFKEPGDMFRGRLMIPLMDPFGKVIGFTARLLKDNIDSPKYINTPQTALYDKSRHVFGLHLAKEAIRKSGYAVVTEGNLDVIASHQAGVKQVVATAGTAVTAHHLKSLGRLTHDIRLAFDQDKAGLTAAERSIPLAAQADISLGIITIKDAKDPDELIKKDKSSWQKVIQKPTYAVDWLIDHYKKDLDIGSAQGKRQYTDLLIKVVGGLTDSVERDHYIIKISELIEVSPDALRSKLSQKHTAKVSPRKRVSPQEIDKTQAEYLKLQNHLLALALLSPKLRSYLEPLTTEMFSNKDAQKMLIWMQNFPEAEVTKLHIDSEQTEADYVKMLVLLYEELYQDLEILELRYEASRLQVRLIEQYVNMQKTKLAQLMRESDETETQNLLKKAKELDVLLNSLKEKSSGR